jgi:hypothetical protein
VHTVLPMLERKLRGQTTAVAMRAMQMRRRNNSASASSGQLPSLGLVASSDIESTLSSGTGGGAGGAGGIDAVVRLAHGQLKRAGSQRLNTEAMLQARGGRWRRRRRRWRGGAPQGPWGRAARPARLRGCERA